ncbi:MAG: phosphoenolpyruvate--protein phosphotransferase [Chlamydiales bacterium]|nr:phosphoenolpyruvate--protein phosphotransferase [Chlamydiales bacterium]
MKKEICLCGYPICPGIAIGKSFNFVRDEEKIPEFTVAEKDIDGEVARYYTALKRSRRDLLILQRRLKKEGGTQSVDILNAHLEITRDPLMTEQVESEIRKKKKNPEYVFKSVIGEYEKKFSKITDQFFQERVQDFQDISRRVIRHLSQKKKVSLADLEESVIIFAHELLPSDTAEAKSDCIEAFVTRSGSETSHVAIMARAKGIPFVSKVNFPDTIDASVVIVDGTTGSVILNPSQSTLEYYKKEQKMLTVKAKGLQQSGSLGAETIDGHRVRLLANVEMFNELDSLQKYGGEGVGLFRSEYLFLARDAFPTEEEQFLVYRSIVEKVNGYPCVIRTFDIGGDKLGNFYPTRCEKNPFLGCRAIRLMLQERTAFKTQMRAILRASAFGDVAILFPMISGLMELREAKVILEEAKEELKKKGIPFEQNMPIGCMIEVPSAAIAADILAKECDFLSIGTNDLVQYSLAVDRGNPTMSYLYTPAHPSVIRLLSFVVKAASEARKPIAVCGEIAADPRFTALLLGLGVKEFSIASPSLPLIKNIIRRTSIVEATALAESILTLETYLEIEEALEEFYNKIQSAFPL